MQGIPFWEWWGGTSHRRGLSPRRLLICRLIFMQNFLWDIAIFPYILFENICLFFYFFLIQAIYFHFPTEYLIKLLKIVMGSNIFKFDDELWIQLIGTSMGTRAAPTYANIFMGKLEQILLSKCPQNLKKFVHTWKRFMDNIFIIWTGSYSQFDDFFQFINSYHPTIKCDPPQHNQ